MFSDNRLCLAGNYTPDPASLHNDRLGLGGAPGPWTVRMDVSGHPRCQQDNSCDCEFFFIAFFTGLSLSVFVFG